MLVSIYMYIDYCYYYYYYKMMLVFLIVLSYFHVPEIYTSNYDYAGSKLEQQLED